MDCTVWYCVKRAVYCVGCFRVMIFNSTSIYLVHILLECIILYWNVSYYTVMYHTLLEYIVTWSQTLDTSHLINMDKYVFKQICRVIQLMDSSSLTLNSKIEYQASCGASSCSS